MAAFTLCHKFYLLLWILLLLWFNDWCPQPALLLPRFFVTLKTTDQELQENLAVFASHFPSLLTQSPLSNNGRKKIVSYFTVVASVWCHGMFFFLVMCLTNFAVMLATSFLDSMAIFPIPESARQESSMCVVDITTFPAVVSFSQSFKNTILPCRWLQPYPIRSFLAVMVQ